MTARMNGDQLTPAESQYLPDAVLQAITAATQRGHRITAVTLARQFGYRHDRQVRLAIRQLISDGHPVASSVHAPFGYFIVGDVQEADVYEATLRSRACESLRRLLDFRKAMQSHFGKQMPLFDLEEALDDLNRSVNENAI